jgi:metal-responsive CopG/Arc/MetJ family transcriptional regulator
MFLQRFHDSADVGAVGSTVEYNPHMQTIQVVLEEKLLKDTDRVVRKKKTNRSALIREALREHLYRLHIRELEEQERRGYEKHPDDPKEIESWEREQVWPD